MNRHDGNGPGNNSQPEQHGNAHGNNSLDGATAAPEASSAHATFGPGPIPAAHMHTPHHIAEFGQVEDIVHIEQRHSLEDEQAQPLPPVQRKDKLAVQERLGRLGRRLFHERHVHQYWHNEVLYRTEGARSIGPDELFLDLVIVGGIAALGHELRESFTGWSDVEKFLLLFGAIHISWRTVVFLWNVWGVASDLIDKAGIYLVFTALTFVALSAHGAFSDSLRPYVSLSAFFASAIPSFTTALWGAREPLLKNSRNIINHYVLLGCVGIITVLPFFAAAFVSSERAARILFWIALAQSMTLNYISATIYRLIHRNRSGITRMALSIELTVEKYSTLTMIVIGESVLGILFEGALLVTREGVSLNSLYGATAAATAMLYSLQTVYNNIDSAIPIGGVHAIRHRVYNAIFWSTIQVPYQAALVLFATGLGIALRDIAIVPTKSETGRVLLDAAHAAHWAVRAGGGDDGTDEGYPQFGSKERWLFSAGWGASLLLSASLSATHLGGPRAATKPYRLAVRSVLTLGIAIGMPFADVSAEHFLGVYAGVLVGIAVVEYVLVQMDRVGMFRSEMTALGSSQDEMTMMIEDVFGDQTNMGDIEESVSNHSGSEEANETRIHALTEELKARMSRGHRKRLVAVKKKKEATSREGGEEKKGGV